MDNIITSRELQVERKHYYIEFCENTRGQFLRITEDSNGRRNSVIIPSTGLDDFAETVHEITESMGQLETAEPALGRR